MVFLKLYFVYIYIFNIVYINSIISNIYLFINHSLIMKIKIIKYIYIYYIKIISLEIQFIFIIMTKMIKLFS